MAQKFWNFRIYTNLNPFTNWYLSKKLKIYPRLKTTIKEPKEYVNIIDLQKFVVDSENKLIDVYTDIYDEYYSGKEKSNGD